MEAKVVLYPTMDVSHMIPMVQLAELFLHHGVSVSIAVINPPVMPTSTMNLISKFSSTNPEISFHLLPVLAPLPNPSPNHFVDMLHTVNSNNTELLSYLRTQSKTSSIAALVIDFFCVHSLDVAAELGIPVYIFYASSASDLAVSLSLPELLPTIECALQDVGKNPVAIPGVPLLQASDLPRQVLELDTEGHQLLFNVFRRLPEAKGILVNTFESLEPRAVKAITDGLGLSAQPAPPIYCIGPLVTPANEKQRVTHPCLTWLDVAPKESVVYLSFGSGGNFSVEQLREMANGIEKSGHRFLWVVRNPPSNDLAKPYDPLAEPDLDALLPEGFLDRTKERGMVVKSWAPQVEILQHESIGGFVSHCGWSSVLEAISSGVPIICWPLFAEQRMNKVFLVEEMKIGVELKGVNEGLVPSDELAEKVRWLMESDDGNKLRNNVLTHKVNGLAALKEGGISETAFLEFLRNLKP